MHISLTVEHCPLGSVYVHDGQKMLGYGGCGEGSIVAGAEHGRLGGINGVLPRAGQAAGAGRSICAYSMVQQAR